MDAEEKAGRVTGKITLSVEELEAMIQKTAKETVKELREEEKRKKKYTKNQDTISLMRCYRDAVFHIEHMTSEGFQLQVEGMTKEQREIYLRRIRKTRFKTMLMTANIDKVIDEMARRRAAAGREQEYQVFDMYFMQGMTYEQIIEQIEKETGERLGKNTPRRWVMGIIEEMDVMLWGLEEED